MKASMPPGSLSGTVSVVAQVGVGLIFDHAAFAVDCHGIQPVQRIGCHLAGLMNAADDRFRCLVLLAQSRLQQIQAFGGELHMVCFGIRRDLRQEGVEVQVRTASERMGHAVHDVGDRSFIQPLTRLTECFQFGRRQIDPEP